MKSAGPKYRLFEQLARIARAMGSPPRLELIEMLAQGERSVEALARSVRLPIANVSHHLQVLRETGLVTGRKQGLFVHYRLAGPGVFELYRLLADVGRRQLAEIDAIVHRFFESPDVMEPVGRAELLQRVRVGSVVVLDVRPPEEYAAGHVPGAISLPLESLEAGLERLPGNTPIVAYCRGPYCVMAFEAVRRLREQGRDARRLEGGFPEWRAEGLPVAVGHALGAGRKAEAVDPRGAGGRTVRPTARMRPTRPASRSRRAKEGTR